MFFCPIYDPSILRNLYHVMSVMLPGVPNPGNRHVAALSLLRLTADKGFTANQWVLPAWQSLVSTDSYSEEEINFFHLSHQNKAGRE